MLLLFTLVVSITKGQPHPSLPNLQVSRWTGPPRCLERLHRSRQPALTVTLHIYNYVDLTKGFVFCSIGWYLQLLVKRRLKTHYWSHPETPLFRCTSAPTILLPTSARCDRYPDCPTGEVNQTIPYHTIPYQTIPYHTKQYHTIPYHTIPYHTIPYQTKPYHIKQNHTISNHIWSVPLGR